MKDSDKKRPQLTRVVSGDKQDPEEVTGNLGGSGVRLDGVTDDPRPKTLDEYVGQRDLIANLKVYLHAARTRREPIDHVLFYGPPGLGKTTLARLIAHEMGGQLKQTSGPAIQHKGELAGLLTGLEPGDVLFIDEIHRLSRPIEEALYPAMEDFSFDIMIGEGPGARSVKLELPRFTLVGATTRFGALSAPLRDRFGIQMRLDFYEVEDLCRIVEKGAAIYKTHIDPDGAHEIARRSRGTPRVALRLLRRVRDFADASNNGRVDRQLADMALKRLDIDAVGLDPLDRRYLEILITRFQGGPRGVETMAATLSEEVETLEASVEPFLLKEGFIERTSRGRVALERAYKHLGLKAVGTPSLF